MSERTSSSSDGIGRLTVGVVASPGHPVSRIGRKSPSTLLPRPPTATYRGRISRTYRCRQGCTLCTENFSHRLTLMELSKIFNFHRYFSPAAMQQEARKHNFMHEVGLVQKVRPKTISGLADPKSKMKAFEERNTDRGGTQPAVP